MKHKKVYIYIYISTFAVEKIHILGILQWPKLGQREIILKWLESEIFSTCITVNKKTMKISHQTGFKVHSILRL